MKPNAIYKNNGSPIFLGAGPSVEAVVWSFFCLLLQGCFFLYILFFNAQPQPDFGRMHAVKVQVVSLSKG